MSNSNTFADFITSSISLDALERMTDEMDKDIAESQKLMDQIKTIFDTFPAQKQPQTDNGLRHQDVSNFLEADTPKLLLPDMSDSLLDVDLDDVVATMKTYAEDLQKNYKEPGPKLASTSKGTPKLDLDEYAYSLDQLGKRLANIKISQREQVNSRNPELEEKLSQLCEDVTNFTQMVQAKTRLSEANKTWSDSQQYNKSLQYNDVISKLLAGLNEVTYLLQNTTKK